MKRTRMWVGRPYSCMSFEFLATELVYLEPSVYQLQSTVCRRYWLLLQATVAPGFASEKLWFSESAGLSDLGQLVCPVLSWRRVVEFCLSFSCCEDMSDDFYAIYVSDQKPEYLNHLSFLQWISPNYLQKLGRSLGHKSLCGRRVYPLKEASIFMYRKGKFRLGFTKRYSVPGSLGDAAHLFCGADVRLYGCKDRFRRQRNPSGSESQLQQLALRWSLVIY